MIISDRKANRAVIFDIDGTLSVVGDRVKHLQKDKPDWDSFYNECIYDKYNGVAFAVLAAMYDAGYDIYFVTGRRESCRKDTLEWFKEINVRVDTSHLRMRKDGDFRHDSDVKPELVSDLDDVMLIFEDRNSMVKKWRELGYTCYQVADGDF